MATFRRFRYGLRLFEIEFNRLNNRLILDIRRPFQRLFCFFAGSLRLQVVGYRISSTVFYSPGRGFARSPGSSTCWPTLGCCRAA